MRDWRHALTAAFARRGYVADIDIIEELNAHAEAAYDGARAQGLDDDDATAQVETLVEAWAAEGGTLCRPSHRPAAVVPPPADERILITVWRDARYGARLLARRPVFALLMALTMALGIGAVSTLATVVGGVLLRPLPWAEPDRLVRVTETRAGRNGRVVGTMMNATYVAWAEHPTTVEAIGGWTRSQMRTLTAQSTDAIRIAVVPVTPSAFSVLRVHPWQGRLFVEGDAIRGEPIGALLSWGLWQEAFGGRAEVVGETIQLDGQIHRVVGVMPREFGFPDRATRLWTAWRVPNPIGEQGMQVGVIFSAIARLRPGVSTSQAEAEATSRAGTAPDLSVVAQAMFGAAGPIRVHVAAMRDALVADVRPALLVLFAAAILLFVVALANVASVQVARATSRRREMAVRAALGAAPSRLWRQLVIESLLLGLAGGACGIGLTWSLCRLLPAWLPDDFPRQEMIAVDARVLLVAVLLALVSGLICGLAEAWHLRRLNLLSTLAEDASAPVGGTLRLSIARTRAALVVCQVATSSVLLIGAGLLARSFVALLHVDRGYDPVNVLTARLPFPRDYPAASRAQAMTQIQDRLRAVPGIADVAFGTSLPLLSIGGATAFRMPSPIDPAVEVEVQAVQRIVSPDYFKALRVRLVSGRSLTEDDRAATPPVLLVSRSFAVKYLGRDAVGAHIPQQSRRVGVPFVNAPRTAEVVGVVDDQWQDSLAHATEPEMFVSFAQIDQDALTTFEPILAVRTVSDPAAFAPVLRAQVRDVLPTAALDSVMTMEDRLATSLAHPRLYAVVLALFATFTVLLSSVGLFGTVSHAVLIRTRELGIRMALGADSRSIKRLVLRQVGTMVGAGVVTGSILAYVAVSYLQSFLYGVAPHDVLTFVVVIVAIATLSYVACLGPLRHASTLQPLQALRHS